MNRSPPGLPVHHQLPESTQTHLHRVGELAAPEAELAAGWPALPALLPASRLSWPGLREAGRHLLAFLVPGDTVVLN